MQSGFEGQIRNELLSEIDTLEKNYEKIKDIRSGVTYEISDIKGILQSLKDSLTKVSSLFMLLLQIKGSKVEALPINPLLEQIDLALSMITFYSPTDPSKIIQLCLSLSSVKIENVMSLISVLKKVI